MSATSIMLVAFGALVLAHWANNETTLSVKVLVEMLVAILFIAFLESNAETAGIAHGLALLFLAATLLSNKSILAALPKITGSTGKKA